VEERQFTVSAEDAAGRIDKYLALKLGEGYSRTCVKMLIDSGLVLVNGGRVKASYIASPDDKVVIKMLPAEASDIEPEDIPLDIIYEDEWLIVVNKPAGMVVHPAAGNRKGTLVAALLHHCGKLPQTDNELRPGIVHRLDKDTSGVMVVAKRARALRSLAKQFQKRAVKKSYTALVKGRLQMDNGVIEAPLARHVVDRKKIDINYAEGKGARTIYHVVRRFKNATLVRLDLETGRTHQIRVHMKHLGHPVLGDAKYGGENSGIDRQALHAEMLGFTHPDTGRYVEFHAPVPEDIKLFIAGIDKA